MSATAPNSSTPPSPEELARARIKEFESWWTRVWESLPFLFDVAAGFFAWFFVWPFAVNVTEKLAVLGFIFVVLTAIGIQVRNAANQIVTVFFLTRRRRAKRPTGS